MKDSRKILIFSTAYYPFVGGAEVAVKEITDRIPDTQFDLITAKMDKSLPKVEKVGNVNVYRLGVGIATLDKLLLPFWGAIKALLLDRKNHYDWYWCIMATFASGAAYIANILRLWRPVPIILNLQEGDSEQHFARKWWGLINLSWKMALRRTRQLTVLSQYLKERAERFGYRGTVNIVPNGVDIQKFDIEITKEEKNQIRHIWKAEEDDLVLITTSRLNIKNGIADVIKALPMLPDDLKNHIKFVICGEGELESNLKNVAADLKVSERVSFVGNVSRDDLPKYLKSADIFIRPSLSEGMGISFLEAMAAKLPVIATPVGGIVDFLVDNETGYFCQPQDPKSIADTVSRVINDVGENRVIENAYNMVVKKYDWDNIAEQMEKVVENIGFSKRLKILLTTGIFPPEIGGPATYSALLEKELPKFGIDVEVLPFRVVRSLPKVIRHFAFFLKVLKQSKSKDLLYSQDPVSVGFPTMLAAKLLRKPFLVRIAGDYAWEQATQRYGVKEGIDDFQNKKYGWKVEFLRKIQTMTSRNAKRVINPSKYFCNLVSNWAPRKISAVPIYNGIDFKEVPRPKEVYEPNTIISAGRLVPWKGFDVLIELMTDLPEWKLYIAGDGPGRVALEQLIEKHKLKERVFPLGSVPRKELMDKMQQCEIFILNTAFESFSFQVVEAMRVGVPVITTNIGNLSEIIDDGKEGILVEPNNKKQLLAAIQKMQNKYFRHSVLSAAFKKSDMFSVENTLSKTSEVIKELV